MLENPCIELGEDRCKFYDGTVVRSKIRGELETNPVTFADLADFDGRERTSAIVAWNDLPAWSSPNYYDSPEVKGIIQEIIDQDGWASGNALVLFWDDFDDLSDHNTNCRRYGGAWDAASHDPPRLHIEYTAPPVGQPYIKRVQAIAGMRTIGVNQSG
jgi:hypothetical protein